MFRFIVLFGLLISSPLSFAQRRPGAARPGGIDVSVRVSFENSRPAGELLDVQLQTSSGMFVGQQFTDSRGEARFGGVRPGSYRVRVKGNGIEEIAGDAFEITPLDMASYQMITVHRTTEALAAEKAAAPPVTAAELNIPARARKEFEKGKELFDKKKSAEAIKRFTKATEIYPQYAAAFDMLGVIASHRSSAEAKTYFQQAISADKSYIPAAAHLARLYVVERDFIGAEPLLNRTLAISPQATEALFLLAYVQEKLAKYEDAIRTSNRLHQLDHRDLALVHFVAAESYTSLKRPQDAIAQYEMYLQEAPLGPSAEIARKNISVIQARSVAK